MTYLNYAEALEAMKRGCVVKDVDSEAFYRWNNAIEKQWKGAWRKWGSEFAWTYSRKCFVVINEATTDKKA